MTSLEQVLGQPEPHSEALSQTRQTTKNLLGGVGGGGSEAAQQGRHLLSKPTELGTPGTHIKRERKN